MVSWLGWPAAQVPSRRPDRLWILARTRPAATGVASSRWPRGPWLTFFARQWARPARRTRRKQHGLYADLMADGTLSLPSDMTESDARDAVAQARAVGSSAALLHDKESLAGFAIRRQSP